MYERIVHFDMKEHTRKQAEGMVRSLTLAISGQAKLNVPVRTGHLRRSISSQHEGLTGSVGTNVEYAPYQEYGTVRSAAQPYLRPAVDSVRGQALRMWGS